MRHHGAETWIEQRGARLIAGEHVVRAALVGGLAVRHRAADRDLVRNLGGVLQMFVDPHAGDVRFNAAEWAAIFDGGEWLGIPAFLVRHATGHENVNDAFRRALLASGRILSRLSLLQLKECGERES